MTPRRWMIGLALSGALFASGCEHCCKKRLGGPNNTGGPVGPTTGPAFIPPQQIPLPDAPPRTGMRPEVLLPAPVPPSTSKYTPPPRPVVVLGEPDFEAPAPAVEEKKPAVKTPLMPAIADDAAAFPIGIAAFAPVKDNVSAGRRAELSGLDWLRSKGYKSVLYLRDSNENDSSDRKQVEDHGMHYRSLTVTPETIGQDLVNEFNRVVSEPSNRPLFVYDTNGARAGAMWYLHFRTADSLTDEEARLRAGRFGLKDKGDDAQIQLWTAVQKYLADRKK